MSFDENVRKDLNPLEIMKTKLTPQQLDECREAFELYMNEKDNTITTSELVSALRALGYNSNQVILDKIKEMDIEKEDGVSKLKFQDFLNFVVTYIRYAFSMEDMLSDFKLIDADNDGKITRIELQSYLESLKIPFSDEEIAEIVEEADLNNDGHIDYKEVVIMMCPKENLKSQF
jgi:Ca2+-binding EF-hand superfamily protein